jgi:hypothetical protein
VDVYGPTVRSEWQRGGGEVKKEEIGVPRYRGAPIKASGVPVSRGMIANIEVVEMDLASINDEVVGDDDARHGGEEYTPAGNDPTTR